MECRFHDDSVSAKDGLDADKDKDDSEPETARRSLTTGCPRHRTLRLAKQLAVATLLRAEAIRHRHRAVTKNSHAVPETSGQCSEFTK
eukprot:scaffold69797_cov36-Tisochrysis_lutea.AAC.1